MMAVVKIKLFRNVQEFYHWMGIYSPSFNQNHSINRRIILLLLSMAPIICSTAGFLIFSNNASAVDRAQIFYVCLTHIACTVNFLISFGKKRNIFLYIEKLEEYIEKCKLSSISMWCNSKSVNRCTLNLITH